MKSIYALLLIVMVTMVGASQNVSAQITIVERIQQDTSGRVKIEQPTALLERLKPVEKKTTATEESDNVALKNSTQTEATEAPNDAENQQVAPKSQAVGYRIQAFADNNPRTAKGEASAKAASIRSKFPSLNTYITYKAPMWRLKVGDFRTLGEAQEMLHEIKKTIPSIGRECIVVRDRINIYK